MLVQVLLALLLCSGHLAPAAAANKVPVPSTTAAPAADAATTATGSSAAANLAGTKGDSSTSFAQCMQAAGITTIYGDHPSYEAARRTKNLFSAGFPAAVAYPATTQQVAAAVRCARAAHMRVHPRGGGHGNEGEAVATGDLTLDLRNMTAVVLSPDKKTVKVQAGAIMGQLVSGLVRQSNGTRGFPGGGQLSVGVAGFVLGGGFGSYHRSAGLGADQLISLTAVDASGNVLSPVDASNHADLLWACRGGGGGKFAIVTEFVLRTMDITKGQVNFKTVVPYDKAIEVMKLYQKWAPQLPNSFVARGGVDVDEADSKKRTSFTIGGRFVGTVEEAKQALTASGIKAAFKGLLDVSSFSYTYASFVDAYKGLMGFDPPSGRDLLDVFADRDLFEAREAKLHWKCHSLILDEPLNDEALREALAFAQSPGAEVELKTLGGAASKVPVGATAASHMRTGKQLLILRGSRKPISSSVETTAGLQELLASARATTAAIKAIGKNVPAVKSYINFRDSDLPAWADYLSAYYSASTLPAMLCLKAKYDPDDVFHQPIDIPPPAAAGSSGSSSSSSSSDDASADCQRLLQQVSQSTAAYSQSLLASLTQA